VPPTVAGLRAGPPVRRHPGLVRAGHPRLVGTSRGRTGHRTDRSGVPPLTVGTGRKPSLAS
jgi:hypothetical protein